MALPAQHITLFGAQVPIGTDLLFTARQWPYLTIGVEICEDLWIPQPPSSRQALEGATVLVNLSASNEVIGKAAYRHQLVTSQSARCIAAYIYSGCGTDQSTTAVGFGVHCLVSANGHLHAES